MKILDSTVQLSSSHESSSSRSMEITSTTGFRQIFANLAASPPEEQLAARQRVQKLLQSLIDAILAALDGKKCEENIAAGDALPEQLPVAARGREMTWSRHVTESVSEVEKTAVCGKGCVTTSDGRDIAFDFSLDLARDYHRTSTLDESGAVELRDPLIINFEGKSSELTTERISFDLNADGVPEEIPGLGSGSGFLVFDRNGNGKADNGNELFGVASGNGFADLAELDGDHNGWIDEGDAAFKQLAVWSGDAYASLAQRGVGALYTGAVDAPFSLKTEDNELLGQIRAAGVYLTEAGEVGHLQQVDLAVSVPSSGQQKPAEGQHLAA
ncbi:MAG: hypothetical protein H6R13_3778 [Proteobacteria bacterium]|nr:hypothetical protein [Pseudomonadota bacterium]